MDSNKIEALILRATDNGATEEERRTSAVIACQMMRDCDYIANYRKMTKVLEATVDWFRKNKYVLNRLGAKIPIDF